MPAATSRLSVDEFLSMRIFHGISPDAIEWLVGYCRLQRYPAGAVILEPGQANDNLFLIRRGEVRVQLSASTDDTIARLGPGECIGEMSIIERAQASAYAIADTDCELIVLNGTTLWHLIDVSHIVARNLLHILSARLRRDNQVIDTSLEQQHRFEREAKVDALTGLHNRRWLDETLPRLVRRASRGEHSLHLMMLDLDHFKAFNDYYGHLSGDCVLRNVARTVHDHIRANDMAARFGGEEFTILQPDVSTSEAQAMAERLRQVIADLAVVCTPAPELPRITVSIGVAAWRPGQDSDDLIAAADHALYQAKGGGRNRVVVAP